MLKKTLALAMICVFMLSLLCVGSVSATVTNRIIDDFEVGNVGRLDTVQSGSSPENGRYYVSDNLFVQSYNTWSYHFSLREDMGYNNSTGLYLHADVTSLGENAGYRGVVLQTKTFETTAEKSLMISHKYKLLEAVDPNLKLVGNFLGYVGSLGFTQGYYPSGNNSVARFKDNGGTFIKKTGGSTFGTINAGEWYTFTYTVTGAGNTKAVSIYITDEEGNLVANYNDSITLTSDTTLEKYPFYFIPVATEAGATKDEVRIVVDDFVVTEYTNTQKASLDASRTSVAEGETDVAVDKGFDIRFDRPITAPSAGDVTLYRTEDPNKTPVDIEISKNVLDGFTVTPKENLASETDYTLSFENIKNDAGTQGIDGDYDITFKTVEIVIPDPEIEVISDNFNDKSAGTAQTYGSESSGILYGYAESTTPEAFNIIENGYEGKALQASNADRTSILASGDLRTNATVAAPITKVADGTAQYESLVATYRFNITDPAGFSGTDRQSITIGSTTYDNVKLCGMEVLIGAAKTPDDSYKKYLLSKSNAAKIYTASDGKTYIHYDGDSQNRYGAIENNKWYNVIIGVNGAEESITVIDSETGAKVWSHTFTPGNFAAGDKISFVLGGMMSLRFSDDAQTNLYNYNQKISFDDFKLYRIKPWYSNNKLAATYDDASKTLTFNQPVSSADGIQLYKDIVGDNTVDTFAKGSFTYSDFCKIKVEYNENVFPGINYVCDYSKVKSATGVGFAEDNSATNLFNFTVSSAPVSFASAPIYGLDGNSKVTFDFYSDKEQSARFIAAFYNNKQLVKAALVPASLTAGITKGITIPLGEAAITADSFRLFAWDGENKLIPLAVTYDEDIEE